MLSGKTKNVFNGKYDYIPLTSELEQLRADRAFPLQLVLLLQET